MERSTKSCCRAGAGDVQFVVYTTTRVFVFQKYPGSPSFRQVQWGPR